MVLSQSEPMVLSSLPSTNHPQHRGESQGCLSDGYHPDFNTTAWSLQVMVLKSFKSSYFMEPGFQDQLQHEAAF